ncbi:MAG: ABC transporter substrate-binding protein [Chloroflexota bacterium]
MSRPVYVSIPVRAVIRGAVAAMLIGGILFAPRADASPASGLPAAVDQGKVTLLYDVSPPDIDPASNTFNTGDNIERNLDETLIALDGSSLNHYRPVLATSWTVNSDKSVYVFHLRHGVPFHTGRCCMTADDVRYSIARTVSANLGMSYLFARFLSKPLQQIKIRDPYTVEFDLGRSQPMFLGAIASQYAGNILDAKALRAHATKSDPWAHNWATNHDAGTGPYVLSSWVRDQQLVLTKFGKYWGGWSGPHFSTVIERIVPEDVTRRELIERDQADITTDLTPKDYDSLKHNHAVQVVVHQTANIYYIIMTEAGPLAAPAARQALSYAFPYDAMIQGVLRGYAGRAYGPLGSSVLGYDPGMFHYTTDLGKARALLAKAGVKAGTTLTFDYSVDQLGQAGLLLQAQLAQLGITLKVEHLDESAFNAIFYGSEPASQRPNLMGYAWYPDYDDPYDASQPLIDSKAAGPNGVNGGYYHNKQVDSLLAQMQYASGSKLISLAHKMQDITGRVDPPAIWTHQLEDVTVLKHGLKGFVFNPLTIGTYDFYALHR